MLSKVHDFDLIFAACLYTLRSHEVALFHAYIFIDFLWLLFLAGRIWPLMRLSIFFDLLLNVKRATFFLLRLNIPLVGVLGSLLFSKMPSMNRWDFLLALNLMISATCVIFCHAGLSCRMLQFSRIVIYRSKFRRMNCSFSEATSTSISLLTRSRLFLKQW